MFPNIIVCLSTNEFWYLVQKHKYFAEYLDSYTYKKYGVGQTVTIHLSDLNDKLILKGFRYLNNTESILYDL